VQQRSVVLLLAAALSISVFAQQPQTTTAPAATATTQTAAPPASNTIRDEVRAALREETKDSKVVEIELAQAVAARLTEWAKLFGFFVGIPLGIVSLVLGLLGLKSVADFKKLTGHFTEMDKQLTVLQLQITERQKQLAELDKLQADLQRLSEKVHRLEQISFSGAAVSDDVKTRVLGALSEYQMYLRGLGWNAQPGESALTLQVDDSKDPDSYAHYVLETKTMVVGAAYVSEIDLALREFTHHVLLQANPASSPTGRSDNLEQPWWFLESGLAFYFPCGFKNEPHFAPGLPEKVEGTDLTTRKKFADYPATDENYMRIAGVWGATLWDLRKRIGGAEIDQLALAAWSSFRPRSKDFPKAFGRHLIELAPDHAALIKNAFAERGIAL
jgi:hypothetical protein